MVENRRMRQPTLKRNLGVTQHRARAAWAMPSLSKLIMLIIVLQPCDPASLPCHVGMAVSAQECTRSLLSAEGGLDADKGVAGALVLRGGCLDPLPAHVAVLRPECEAEGDTREDFVEGSREAGAGLHEGEWARSAKDAHENGSADFDSGSGSRDLEADYQDTCVVCCESTQHWAIGACGHRVVCPACSLRMRVLLNSTECVTCKRVQPFTIVTAAKCVFEELAKLTSTMLFDTSANVFYDDALAYARMEALRGFHCTKWYTSDVCARVLLWSCCQVQRSSRIRAHRTNALLHVFPHTSSTAHSSSEDLQAHLRRAHNLVMCPLCLVHRKIFIGEQHLYTPGQLQRHLTSRNQQGPQHGHPVCNMCNQHFYDQVCKGMGLRVCVTRMCMCMCVHMCVRMCMCLNARGRSSSLPCFDRRRSELI
jgi:hypothetical protein